MTSLRSQHSFLWKMYCTLCAVDRLGLNLLCHPHARELTFMCTLMSSGPELGWQVKLNLPQVKL